MIFLQFCKKMINTETDLSSVQNSDVPEQYKSITDATVSIMKNKRDILDRVEVPFVEKTFECDWADVLNKNLPEQEIPDGIMYRLSEGIFNKSPHELDIDDQSIIKVLSTYICIQIAMDGK